MKILTAFIAASLLLAAPLADAKDKGKPGHPGKHGAGNGAAVTANCPPGLAKKNPPCVPPGLAKRLPVRDDDHGDDDHHYDDDRIYYVPGDVITRDYIVIHDPITYGLNPESDYFRVGDQFYRVDNETREVIAFVGALADLLN